MRTIFILYLSIFISMNAEISLASQKGSHSDFKAVTAADKLNDIKAAAQKLINEKIKLTGSVDLYDGDIDRVRNLSLLVILDEIKGFKDHYAVIAKFRDVTSGDIVSLNIIVQERDGQYTAQDLEIYKIEKLVSQENTGKKTYGPEDVRAAIKDYLEKKSKFTGSFDFYDEQTSSLRNLEFVKFHDEMRQYGSLHICGVDFADVNNQETVTLDITVENKAGGISVKNVRRAKN